MIRNKLKKLLVICSTLLLSSANNTFAATASGTMSVTGAVAGTCSLAASTMAFGNLSRAGTTTATSTITPNCTSGVTYTVTSAAATTTLLLGGSSSDAAGMILFPLTKTTGGASFASSLNGITGTGTGSASSAGLTTLTGTAESALGKLSGAYSASVTLTITY
jgi:hypothetical protein